MDEMQQTWQDETMPFSYNPFWIKSLNFMPNREWLAWLTAMLNSFTHVAVDTSASINPVHSLPFFADLRSGWVIVEWCNRSGPKSDLDPCSLVAVMS